jgi:HD-GYP domain-containing protein (c-di-GMP phosphodiesterase class II)
MPAPTLRKQDVILSGGFGTSTNSARAGYLPVCMNRLPLGSLDGIAIYLRSGSDPKGKDTFTLLCGENIPFSDRHRERLTAAGVKFVYIPMAQQARFREQTESRLLETAADQTVAVSVRSELIYETSVELVNELLSEPDLSSKSPRLEKVSRAITTLVLNDPTAFSHLFAAAHHDFYTATHMVNVATWMVPLAYAMGHHDVDELNHICQAGLLHDLGKIYIPAEILNKKGRLTTAEFAQIQQHPQAGCQHLEKYEGIHPLVYAVTREHHERMDGTGYPRRLKGEQIHAVSRICAVVDSFDAMTAFRPFKERTMSVAEAMDVIVKETPSKYDPKVVQAWVGLLQAAEKIASPHSDNGGQGISRRAYERFPINCPARLHVMEQAADGIWQERLGLQTVAHNISRAGVGMLTQKPIHPGEHVRVYMLGQASLNRVSDGLAVRCREYRDGWFEVGMSVLPVLPDKPVVPTNITDAAA